MRNARRLRDPALLACMLLAASTARADALHVQMAAEACPNATLLEEKLRPLLGAEATLVVTAEPAATDDARSAVIADLGDRYTIVVDGRSREVDDAARDCVERARVAAVFIALNLRAAPPPPEPPSQEEPPPEPEGLAVGVRLLGQAAYAGALNDGALGGSLGLWLGGHEWQIGLDVGLLSPADVVLETSADSSARVSLMRFPLTHTASYLPRFGDFAFGPTAGLALDLLRLRGKGVDDAKTKLRLNPGVFIAADAYWHLSPAFAALLRLGASAFPRAYDLRVAPDGPLGHTPQLWLSASIGLSWQPD